MTKESEETNRLACEAHIKSINEESRCVDVIASTEAIDSHDEILRQNWRLERYLSNPVVLYGHDRFELPIGSASNVRVEDGALRATITFVDADLNEKADKVWRMIKAKMMRGVSVGFRPHSYRYEKMNDREVLVLDDNELREISIVPIGSNPDALVQLHAKAAASRSALPSPTPPAKDADPTTPKENTSMKLLLIELGLTEAASEAEAVRVLRARTGHVEKLLALTGQPDAGAALGVAEGWKAEAARVPDLTKQLDDINRQRTITDVDAMLKEASGKVTPAELPALRAKGLEDPNWLRGYLAVKSSVMPGSQPGAPIVREPQPNLAGKGTQKSWADMKPRERARLYQEDRPAYEALKAAAGVQ